MFVSSNPRYTYKHYVKYLTKAKKHKDYDALHAEHKSKFKLGRNTIFFEPMRVVPINSTPVTMVHHTHELPVGKIFFNWGEKYSNRETLMIIIRQAQ